VTLNTTLSGVVYHVRTSTRLYQSAHKILSASFTDSKDIKGVKI